MADGCLGKGNKEGCAGEQGSKLKFATEDCDEIKQKSNLFLCNLQRIWRPYG